MLSRIDDVLFGLRSFRAFTDRVRVFVVLPDVLAGQQLSEAVLANIHASLGKIDDGEIRTCTVTNTVNGNSTTQMVHTVTCLGLMGLASELTRIALNGRAAAAGGGNAATTFVDTTKLVDSLNLVVKKLRSVEMQMQSAHGECQGVQQDLFEAEARKQVAALRLEEAILFQRASKARLDRVEEDAKLVRLVNSVFSEFDNQKKVAQPVKEMLASIAHYTSSSLALDSVDTRRELHDAVLDNGDECAPFPVECHVVDDSDSGGSSSESESVTESDTSSQTRIRVGHALSMNNLVPESVQRSHSADEILMVASPAPEE